MTPSGAERREAAPYLLDATRDDAIDEGKLDEEDSRVVSAELHRRGAVEAAQQAWFVALRAAIDALLAELGVVVPPPEATRRQPRIDRSPLDRSDALDAAIERLDGWSDSARSAWSTVRALRAGLAGSEEDVVQSVVRDFHGGVLTDEEIETAARVALSRVIARYYPRDGVTFSAMAGMGMRLETNRQVDVRGRAEETRLRALLASSPTSDVSALARDNGLSEDKVRSLLGLREPPPSPPSGSPPRTTVRGGRLR